MDWSVVREKIAKQGLYKMPESSEFKHKTVFGIDFETIIPAAARRQKWIDPSQSVNLFLATPEMQGASARRNLNRTNHSTLCFFL